MRIPLRFANKLNISEMRAKTDAVINRMENYFTDAELYFFPEYTNHRGKHIERVLEIADKLILEESFSRLSAKDISFLLLGICLHDLGMFIKPEGLQMILSNQEWQNRWQAYIKKASRFSDRELIKIYGDATPFYSPAELIDVLKMTNRDRFTYGDFLRRYHPQVAEDIALLGFPGAHSTMLFSEYSDEERKIIGLLAKSHGMTIREAAKESESLVGKLGVYKPSNTPIVYLMAVLRLADYLDAGYDRASHIIKNMQKLKSPVSEEEWSWNQAIDYSCYNWTTTAETLYIQAEPQSTPQFVKIESWLNSLQNELDLSWAALCDYYNCEFRLSVHRITSNLFEQPHHFEDRFLTQEATIRVNPDIVKLLVDPLYKGEPLYAASYCGHPFYD